MNTKKVAIITLLIIILIAVVLFVLVGSKNGSISKPTKTTVTPTKEVGFVVVRVIPSGFSPKEVTVKQGMIVRFTNPTDTKVSIKWDGNTQYTKELVYKGHDVASSIFEQEGTYTFYDNGNHVGKVIVR